MSKKAKRIIELYNDKSLWRPPSMQTIATLAGTQKSYVHYIIHKHHLSPLPTKRSKTKKK